MKGDETPLSGGFTRRLVLAGAPATAGAAALTGSMDSRSAPQPLRSVNVMDFGAKADGLTDDTAAFNRATRAADPWGTSLQCLVEVPPGKYRIDGPVYVRKGQILQGAGYATEIDARMSQGHTFVLGSGRRQDGRSTPDPGGAPVGVAGMRSIGGASRGAFIFTDAQGFSVRDLFLSAVGTGLHLAGADGLVSDILIDQALNGIIFDGCQNIIVNSIEFYSANYAVTILSRTRDIVIGNSLFCYSSYSAILFAENAENIHNIMLSNSSFIMNAQPHTFSGFVHVRSSITDAKFTGCTFRNWSEFAVTHGAGGSICLYFDGCTFDASKTTSLYNGSANSKILATSLGGEYYFNSCNFLNLRGALASIGPNLKRLQLRGGTFSSASDVRIVCSATPTGPISIADLTGFLPTRISGGAATVLLPWWGESTTWRISALIHSADAVVPMEVLASAVTRRGAQTCAVEIWKGDLTDRVALTACMGDRPGGAVTRPAADQSGIMCLFAQNKSGEILRMDVTAQTFI